MADGWSAEVGGRGDVCQLLPPTFQLGDVSPVAGPPESLGHDPSGGYRLQMVTFFPAFIQS